jgi:hypothetical protein
MEKDPLKVDIGTAGGPELASFADGTEIGSSLF